MTKMIKELLREIETEIEEHPVMTHMIEVMIIAGCLSSVMGIFLCFNWYTEEKNACKMCYSNIGIEMRLRQNLIPKCVEYFCKYVTYEKKIMTHIVKLREEIACSKDVNERIKSAQKMEELWFNMRIMVENYPDLRASDSAQNLLNRISETEKRIADYKWKYNHSARLCNEYFLHYPASFLGYWYGYKQPMSYIATDADLIKVPLVEFSEFRN